MGTCFLNHQLLESKMKALGFGAELFFLHELNFLIKFQFLLLNSIELIAGIFAPKSLHFQDISLLVNMMIHS